ncbi:MAG: FHA domain-containing protein [Myxococcota bacterium]|nr:FHA domain-containing protein [Myxococcota bacterium]
MGSLIPPNGHPVALSARSVLGRAPGCQIQVSDPRVSGEHLVLTWSGGCWHVRDLGSSNGTWLDGERLHPGDKRPLRTGSALGLASEDTLWRLGDASPPGAVARCDDGRVVRAQGGVLLLPDDRSPRLALFERSGAWVREDSDATVRSGDTLELDGARWVLELPHGLPATLEAERAPELHFQVSPDEEYCTITLHHGERRVEHGPRSFNYLLLTLARLREQDHQLPTANRGWVHQEDLARMLRLEPTTINVQIYRARQALGVLVAGLGTELIERRARTRQLRLGVERFRITQIGDYS